MRGAVLFLIALFALGCQGSKQGTISQAGTAPRASLGPATRYDLPTFSIELPVEWVVADFTRKDFNQLLTQHAANNPQIKEMLPMLQQMAFSGQIRLFAFDAPTTQGTFTDNLNILELPLPGGATLDALLAAGTEQLRAMRASGFKESRMTVNGNEIGVLKFDMPQQGPKGEIIDLALAQYFCIAGGRQFVATFTSNRNSAVKFHGLAEAAMQTFKPK